MLTSSRHGIDDEVRPGGRGEQPPRPLGLKFRYFLSLARPACLSSQRHLFPRYSVRFRSRSSRFLSRVSRNVSSNLIIFVHAISNRNAVAMRSVMSELTPVSRFLPMISSSPCWNDSPL